MTVCSLILPDIANCKTPVLSLLHNLLNNLARISFSFHQGLATIQHVLDTGKLLGLDTGQLLQTCENRKTFCKRY